MAKLAGFKAGSTAFLLVASLVGLTGCRSTQARTSFAVDRHSQPRPSAADRIVPAARTQIGTLYTQEYFSLPYPNGDLPRDANGRLQGACTDVVIRSLRAAGIDLQRLIHQDMARHFNLYPQRYGLHRPDPSIDHRRVPNQVVWMRRHARGLSLSTAPSNLSQWQAGDIVYWKLDSDLDHCGIISDRRDEYGLPLVIHNIGGCREEPVLRAWKIVGHFRVGLLSPAGRRARSAMAPLLRVWNGQRRRSFLTSANFSNIRRLLS